MAVGALTKFMSLYDTAAVAALGIVVLDMLPLYFSIGVANGLLPLLAYNYSAENHERRHRIFLCGCAVAVGFSVVCVAGYEVFAPALVRIFIGDAQTIAYGTKLLRIMVLAMPMMSVCYPMITQFQAMGRMRESLICSILRKGLARHPAAVCAQRAVSALWLRRRAADRRLHLHDRRHLFLQKLPTA